MYNKGWLFSFSYQNLLSIVAVACEPLLHPGFETVIHQSIVLSDLRAEIPSAVTRLGL